MSRVAYREHAPPRGLEGHVACFWTARSDGPLDAAAHNRVLPDGCADVIFDLGDADVRADAADDAGHSFVVGTMTQALLVRQDGRVDLLGVRFRPGGSPAFLRLPLSEVTDRRVPLDALAADWRTLDGRIRAAGTDEERRALLADALARRFRPDLESDRLIGSAWSRLETTSGGVPVRALADAVGVGERRLLRLFRERVGLSPKEAARYARFRAALTRLEHWTGAPLGRIGLEAGYYDQPHFIREFSRFAGLTPEAWRRERRSRDAAV